MSGKMKKKISLFVIMIGIIGWVGAQTTSEKRAKAFKETVQLVETGDFTFVANSALSSAGSNASLTTIDNLLKIKGNQIEARLPYYGESRLGTGYPGGGPILIDGMALEYKTQINERKRRITITFSTMGKDELHRATLIISGGGFADLTIRSIDRTRIVYRGTITATAKGE